MNCPIDHNPLTPHTKSAWVIHACAQCHGLWLAKTDLEKWLRLVGAPSGEILKPVPSPRAMPAATPGSCPSCLVERMIVKRLNGIELDICPHCGGVWFDAGEIDQLLRWHRRKHKHEVAPTGNQSSGWDLVDLPVEGTFELAPLISEALGKAPAAAGEIAGALLEFLADALGDLF